MYQRVVLYMPIAYTEMENGILDELNADSEFFCGSATLYIAYSLLAKLLRLFVPKFAKLTTSHKQGITMHMMHCPHAYQLSSPVIFQAQDAAINSVLHIHHRQPCWRLQPNMKIM